MYSIFHAKFDAESVCHPGLREDRMDDAILAVLGVFGPFYERDSSLEDGDIPNRPVEPHVPAQCHVRMPKSTQPICGFTPATPNAIVNARHGGIVYAVVVNVCVLQVLLTPFKGANHLPLFAAARDVRFTIVCNRSSVREEDLPSNVRVVAVPGHIGSYYYGFADFLFARRLLKQYPVTSEFWKGFDVIHINQTMGPALRKLRMCGRPLLFLIHHPVTADREVAVSESGIFRALTWRVKYTLLARWQRAMCTVAGRIVTVSQTMQKRIAADYRCPTKKISVVPNGVDGDAFTPVADAECEFDVIAVGSFLHPRKGFPYLLTVYRRLAASGRRIADIGRRSEAQEAVLRGIPGVTVHGTVGGDTLINLMRHSRVLVSVSLFEGFGLSLIEALACGHPAFAFGVGAVPEVLGAVDSALVVPARDTARLVQLVDGYLSLSPAERDRRGAQYRQKVLNSFSLSASAEALQALYRELAQ